MYCYKHGAGPNVCMGIYYRVTEGQPNKVGCFSASVTSRDETIDCIKDETHMKITISTFGGVPMEDEES